MSEQWFEYCPFCKIKLSAETEAALRALKENHTYICAMFQQAGGEDSGFKVSS